MVFVFLNNETEDFIKLGIMCYIKENFHGHHLSENNDYLATVCTVKYWSRVVMNIY